MHLVPIVFCAQAQAAANVAHAVKLPRGAMFVGASFHVEGLSGSPTNVIFDIGGGSDGTTAIKAAAATLTAAGCAEYLTRHLGGANDPYALSDGDWLAIDVNFTDGSTPKADYEIVLWLLMGEV